jgi:hypothetical protein
MIYLFIFIAAFRLLGPWQRYHSDNLYSSMLLLVKDTPASVSFISGRGCFDKYPNVHTYNFRKVGEMRVIKVSRFVNKMP